MSIYDIEQDRVDEAVERFREAIETIAYMEGLTDAYFLVSVDSDRAAADAVAHARRDGREQGDGQPSAQ